MTTVEQAEKLILEQARDFGLESIAFENGLGRTLAEDLLADRDFPPFNRVTMDGIAISYAAVTQGIRSYRIKATQAAGCAPVDIDQSDECIEIMTGAALPATLDTVVPYELIELNDGTASVRAEAIVKGQNLHLKGADKKKGEKL